MKVIPSRNEDSWSYLQTMKVRSGKTPWNNMQDMKAKPPETLRLHVQDYRPCKM